MDLRNTKPRNRILDKECSLWNPLFLHFKSVIEAIKKYFNELPSDQKLVIYDFGCGQKPYEFFISDHKYIGIDIDKQNIKADIHANISSVPVDSNTADIVVSFFVLEHLKNPQEAVDEMFRILKNGGEVFMMLPLYWEEHEQPWDFFRFTRFAIESMLKMAGFKEIYIEEINSTYSIAGMNLARLLNKGTLRVMVPLINIFFYKLELRNMRRAKVRKIKLSNIMTFKVRGTK